MAILTIDQGTTGSTILLVARDGSILHRAYHEFTQYFPEPGWVEHDPHEIWDTVVTGIGEVLEHYTGSVEALGITNQRETTVLWDSRTGRVVYNAIVWQCRRTAALCEQLRDRTDLIREKTGLPLDAYFSATKVRWILEHAEIPAGAELRFGTIDSWLIWKLTDGQVHATDYTNASRTMLFNIHKKQWDRELCDLFKVNPSFLPAVLESSADYGEITSIPALRGVHIRGVAGDQQASLFGQQCFLKGEAKNTYGTGCFIMMNTGSEAVQSKQGLITTLAADPQGRPCYALEGSIFIAGAAIQWLRDELGLLDRASDSEAAALAVPDNGGVYLVPAFVGLGAPYWDMKARGILTGLTRGSNRNHIIRAALEAMAYQTLDVVRAMEAEIGAPLRSLAVDGGATANDFLMQFQADILNTSILRAAQAETTALGAAYLAGLGVGFWTLQDLKTLAGAQKQFHPKMTSKTREGFILGWRTAIRKAQSK